MDSPVNGTSGEAWKNAPSSWACTISPQSVGGPARRGIALRADMPDGECRHGPPELVVGCKHRVIPMPSPATANPLRTRVQSLLCYVDQEFSIPH